jgi:hypothetical protein
LGASNASSLSSGLGRFNDEDLGVAISLLGSPSPCSPSSEGPTGGSGEPENEICCCPFSPPCNDPVGDSSRCIGLGRGRALGVTGSASLASSRAASSSTTGFARVARFGFGRAAASSSSSVFSPSLSSALEAAAAPLFAPFLGFLTLGACANRLVQNNEKGKGGDELLTIVFRHDCS